ncbi:hypothetical protein CVD28_00260 [Bacillus sp. M6-12]|uniref:immunity 22 family protein n=1 Tax=Bacillus sp. M6-12 TaxID=2054166 RepID=UPI000C761DBC|nr:immunity 22 family protein [Bacillus sp. M6-12]PLS18868.1 hypothetical protein CVD28_00260 [Bacillus sp. M6-12]
MEKEGFVSMWVGSISSPEELDSLLKISYTEDGDSIPSIFSLGFNIERYDDSLSESEFCYKSDKLIGKLLEGFSFDDVIISNVYDLLGSELTNEYNAVILLYNFYYEGSNKKAIINGNNLEFLCTVKYM